MKKEFVRPWCSFVRFNSSIIASSSQCCDVGGIVMEGDGECPNLNLPECSCKLNVSDPDAGNCV